MPDPLYVKSKIRDYVKEKGLMTGSDVVDGDKLNERLTSLLDNAIDRAKANGRKTLKARDL